METIDHINIVVKDLERMVEFYTRLGLRATKRVTISGKWIDQTVGLRDVEADVVYMEMPQGPRVELLKYRRPKEGECPGAGQANTMGLRHLAFRVKEIEVLVEKLKADGIEFLSEVQLVPDEQVTYAGGVRKRLVYFRDPEGNLLELCEYRG